ncbi:hypothetical protein [Endozoicomonas sp.]|uniref:hypothetical protein n=1 Tax=Endozoicomonas sp. TaxID=1892382 RepID=UPI002884B5BA|nr:hypothetical protein [Endozoicomonas sp.]
MSADELENSDFDEVIVATGIAPGKLDIEGIDHNKVLSYLDVFKGAPVGNRVAVIGAGGRRCQHPDFRRPPPRYS